MKTIKIEELNIEVTPLKEWTKPYNEIKIPEGFRLIKLHELIFILEESKSAEEFLGKFKGQYHYIWTEQTKFAKENNYSSRLDVYGGGGLGSDWGSLADSGSLGRVAMVKIPTEIELNEEDKVLFDFEDYEKISKFKWRILKKNANKYAVSKTGTLMHKLILPCDNKFEIDHINHNGLDNRRNNLRIVTHAQNMQNSRKIKKSTSKYKGVSWNKHHKKWKAEISGNKITRLIGYFTSEEEAGLAYNKEAKKRYKEYANLNIINNSLKKEEK